MDNKIRTNLIKKSLDQTVCHAFINRFFIGYSFLILIFSSVVILSFLSPSRSAVVTQSFTSPHLVNLPSENHSKYEVSQQIILSAEGLQSTYSYASKFLPDSSLKAPRKAAGWPSSFMISCFDIPRDMLLSRLVEVTQPDKIKIERITKNTIFLFIAKI